MQTKLWGYKRITLSICLCNYAWLLSFICFLLIVIFHTFLLHTKIADHLKVCHDFDPWSFEQAQCHWKEKLHKFVRSIPFLWKT